MNRQHSSDTVSTESLKKAELFLLSMFLLIGAVTLWIWDGLEQGKEYEKLHKQSVPSPSPMEHVAQQQVQKESQRGSV